MASQSSPHSACSAGLVVPHRDSTPGSPAHRAKQVVSLVSSFCVDGGNRTIPVHMHDQMRVFDCHHRQFAIVDVEWVGHEPQMYSGAKGFGTPERGWTRMKYRTSITGRSKFQCLR
ncbi:hypothetical protein NSERUTF1_4199 [Nocardia seriolae]|nr:hypothetical protein NSERUTF1_4199 [Nocardia seriolae]